MAHGETTTATRSVAFSRRVLTAHWHALQVVLRLAGVLGSSGWPPRWSRRWTRYGCVTLVAFAIARVALFTYQFFTVFKPQVETARRSSYPDEISYIYWLGTFNLSIQVLTLILTQVLLVHNSRDVSLLIRAVFLYLHSFPGPRHKYVSRHAAIAWFGANFAFNTFYCLSYAHHYFSSDTWSGVFYVLNDLLPNVLISAAQDSFLHVVSANVDFLATIADGVHEHISSLSGLAASGSVAPSAPCSPTCATHCGRARLLLGEQGDAFLDGLRALRVRYQSVQDVVRATNWVYGGFNLLAGTATLFSGVVFLYSGVMLTITFAGVLGDYEDPLPFDAFDGACCSVLGTMQIAQLLFMCAIGGQMSSEIQWFIRQTQMQEIRFGAFDLLYFDLKTMKRIIAAIMTNIVILVQFSALSARGKHREP